VQWTVPLQSSFPAAHWQPPVALHVVPLSQTMPQPPQLAFPAAPVSATHA
jgi:hypothetical protein